MSSLSNLPSIVFAEKDALLIEKEIINQYQSTAGVILGDADPRKKLLQSAVPIIAGQRSAIDKAAKRNLLAFADKAFLDHIGVQVGCTRIAATLSKTTLRFTLTKIRTVSTIIPKGTRVTAGDQIYFATAKELIISSGNLIGDITATCITMGNAGNEYAVGTLITIVDPVAYVSAVTNITASEGGADEESDDDFRERIHLAPEGFSCAGPTGAYEYWAKTASSLIADVKAYSPSAGCVSICVLMDKGELPGTEILNDVLAICSDRKIRPLTDNVSTIAPTQISYDISVTYYISKKNENLIDSISTAVAAAVRAYILWQKEKLGRSVDPSELIHKMKMAGASRVTVAAPAYIELTNIQVAKESENVLINYGGIEDD